MVSEKLVIILIILAILLSTVSIIVTISSVNTKLIPEIIIGNPIPSEETGRVNLVINKPTT